jgi:replicative DNA helicase
VVRTAELGEERIMTTAHRAPLQVVPDDQVDDADIDPTDEWRGESIATQWDPENQLIGALMWMRSTRARTFLELIPDAAIWRPMNRWAYEIIRHLVDAGRDPDPVTVLAHAGQHPATQALHPDQAPTPGQHHRLAMYLADLYTHTVSAAVAANYAREVLDEAYRRAFSEHGMRMQQMADSRADRNDLTAHFATARDDLADLWRRAEAAAQPGWDEP